MTGSFQRAADRLPPPDTADMAHPDSADKLDNREQLVHYSEQ
jgi:hypothetical protein